MAAMVVAVSVARLALPASAQIGVTFLYAIPVALTAWWFGRALALALAAACVGFFVVSTLVRPVEALAVAAAVRALALLATAVLVSNLRERTSHLRTVGMELNALRYALTPPALTPLPGVDAAALFLPSAHGIGGDFYLLTNGPDGLCVAVVGDVVGHGPQAANLATFTRASIASFAANSINPAEVLRLTNQVIRERPAARASEFVTATCVVLDPSTATLTWANAGHPPPIHLDQCRELTTEPVSAPLGVVQTPAITSGTLALGNAEGALIYTDGLIDARNDAGQPFGLERVQRILVATAEKPAEAITAALRTALEEFTGSKFRDDVCAIAIRVRADTPSARV